MLGRFLAAPSLALLSIFFLTGGSHGTLTAQQRSPEDQFLDKWWILAEDIVKTDYELEHVSQVIPLGEIDVAALEALSANIAAESRTLWRSDDPRIEEYHLALRRLLIRAPKTEVVRTGMGERYVGYPSEVGDVKMSVRSRAGGRSMTTEMIKLPHGRLDTRRTTLNNPEFCVWFSEDTGTVHIYPSGKLSAPETPTLLYSAIPMLDLDREKLERWVTRLGGSILIKSLNALVQFTPSGVPLRWATLTSPDVAPERIDRISDRAILSTGLVVPADWDGKLFPALSLRAQKSTGPSGEELLFVMINRIHSVKAATDVADLVVPVPPKIVIADFTMSPSETYSSSRPGEWRSPWKRLLRTDDTRKLVGFMGPVVPGQEDDHSAPTVKTTKTESGKSSQASLQIIGTIALVIGVTCLFFLQSWRRA